MLKIDTEEEKAFILREAAAVKRYHTSRTLRQQTVGEHSFGVMLLVRHIYPQARKELYLAAMHHDLPEYVTGDIPAPVKKAMTDRVLEELHMLEKLSSPLYQSFGLTAFEENVLKWCDLMELVLWCLEDIRLGNLYAAGPCGRGLAWLHASDEVTTRSNCCPTALPLLKEVTATALRMGVTLKE